jgi:hypothetical protein
MNVYKDSKDGMSLGAKEARRALASGAGFLLLCDLIRRA